MRFHTKENKKYFQLLHLNIQQNDRCVPIMKELFLYHMGVRYMTSEEFRTNPLFLRNQFKSDGVFEMPIIKRAKIALDELALIGYDKVNGEHTERMVHFFLDDYKIESVWNDPESKVDKLKPYKAVLSPQFSLYTEMPVAIQAYSIFKSRWCGAFLQSKGLKVIPSLVWGEPDTFWFCFDGIEQGCVVAVSTVGMRKEKDLFMHGYNEMLKRIKPASIICYGEPFEEMKGKIISIDYGETNHLTKLYKKTGQPTRVIQEKSAPICLLKGGGAAGGGGSRRSLPTRHKPNSRLSLYRRGKLEQERYYDGEGKAERDIDYSDHDNPKQHPDVPHEHKWDWSNPDNPGGPEMPIND